nr:hypothetical protein [Tanacetum cinerariifolium]
MTTLVEHKIVAGAENRPPMLENQCMIHGQVVYVYSSNGRKMTRPKKYTELTEAQQLQDDCDVQTTNIILHGLPPDVYALLNHQEADKDIWDRVKLLMKGTELSYQEPKSLYTTNYDQLYAYLSQHERHANEARITRERYLKLLALVANSQTLYNPSQSPQHSAEAQEAGQILDEEQLAFIADPVIAEVQVAQQTIAQNSAFQTEDFDAYDLDYDDISSAKAVLMENLSRCDPDVLFEVPYFYFYPNDMITQDVQEMQYSEQTHIDDYLDNKINSDSNIIPYSQYLQVSQDSGIQDTNSSAPNDLLVPSLVEQMTNHVANLDKKNQTNKLVNGSLTAELERYKERVFIFEQRLNVDLNKCEKLIDSQMEDLIWNRNAKLAAFH